MDNYLEPDIRWNLFNFHDQESFCKRFVLPCPFISSVPDDLKDAYVTVEKLMAFAYYHYELYDEAYRKVVWMFEMAVELRLDQLIAADILKKTDKKKQLYQKLDQLAVHSALANFDRQLQFIRKVRNYHAHPQRNSFAGSACRGPMVAILNTINLLFMEDGEVLKWNTYSKLLSVQFATWSESPLAIWEEDTWVLVGGVVMSACLEVRGELYALCWARYLGPDTAVNRKKQIMEHLYFEVLKDISFSPNGIRAFSLSGEKWLEFRVLDDMQSQLYATWNAEISMENERIKYLCDAYYEDQIGTALEDFIFNYTAKSHCNP